MPSDLRAQARRIAQQQGIDPDVFTALVTAESGWRPTIRSPAGAIGLTQLMPATARGLGVNPLDPIQNLTGGARYLRQQLDRFGGDYTRALAAYNAGPGAVQRYGGVPPYRETQAYVKRVLAGHTPTTPTPAPAPGVPAAAVGGQQLIRTPAPSVEPNLVLDQRAMRAMSDYLARTERQALLGQTVDDPSAIAELLTRATRPTPVTRRDPEVTGLPTTTPTGAPAGTPGRILTGGKLIGTPHAGTHTLGNWESDNAVDIAVPVGTPVYAPAAGTIGRQFGSLGSSNPRMAGLRLHLLTPGEEFYLAHLSRFAPGLAPGQAVQAGQLLGFTGSANGVAHLHAGTRTGDPRRWVTL